MSWLLPVAGHVWFFVCAFCYGKIQKESLAAACIKTALPTGGKRARKRMYMLGASREEGKEGEKFGWKDHERVKPVSLWRGKVEELEYRVRG